jgi:hypothetical protein
LSTDVTLGGLYLPNAREGHVLTSGLFVLNGGISVESSTLHSSVTQLGNFGKKKRLHLFSRFRFLADDTQPDDSPPVNRLLGVEGNFARSLHAEFAAQS